MTHKEEIIQMLQNKIEVGFEKGIQTALQNFESDDEIRQGILVNSIIAKCYKTYKESVVDIQRQISIDITLEELIAIVENITEEKRAKYLNNQKTTVDINELKTGIIDGMSKIVVDDFSKSEYKGTPLESMAVIGSLNYSSKYYTNWLLENNNDFKISEEQIDDIIKECYTKTYDKFLD